MGDRRLPQEAAEGLPYEREHNPQSRGHLPRAGSRGGADRRVVARVDAEVHLASAKGVQVRRAIGSYPVDADGTREDQGADDVHRGCGL